MSVRNNLSNEIRLAAPVVVTNKEKIAYQGIKGANSYEAAQRLFPESDLTAYKSFDDVFRAVEDGECAYGVLPVENSTAGSVAAVYDLILRYRFYIVGAIDMGRISALGNRTDLLDHIGNFARIGHDHLVGLFFSQVAEFLQHLICGLKVDRQ